MIEEKYPLPEAKGWLPWAIMAIVLAACITGLYIMWQTSENHVAMTEAYELSWAACEECAPGIVCPMYYDGMRKRMLDEGYDLEAVNRIIQEKIADVRT